MKTEVQDGLEWRFCQKYLQSWNCCHLSWEFGNSVSGAKDLEFDLGNAEFKVGIRYINNNM